MYSFFLNGVLLPVAPSKMELKITNRNKTISLLQAGEVNVIKSPGLSEISFTALLPNVSYPFAKYKDNRFRAAYYYLEHLEKLKIGMEPFQLVISRRNEAGKYLFDTSMKVSLEDYVIEEKAENNKDIIVNIKLKQYINYEVIELHPNNDNTESSDIYYTKVSTRPAPKADKSYVVKKGDTLWRICKRKLNDGSKYKAVAELNNIQDPNRIEPGQVIRFE